MAEQRGELPRRVALKIIKEGMDTREVIARFEAERRALALMEHSHIAKVFDAGATETGRPYFVMELVRGVPITQFCDEKIYTIRQRLALFMEVCDAVTHAHQKGIIHRDLKPSNILVGLDGDKPVPKVIDFGIAKATQQRLTEKTYFTSFRQFIGTFPYLCPEQSDLSALDIDTRADIYALGVVLYELLAGRLPFDPKTLSKAGFEAMRRVVRDEEPPIPSTQVATLRGEERRVVETSHGAEMDKLQSLIRGDLDWIVMKAMEKDRDRRYETANALRRDVERFLNDEPVEAGPPGTLYKVRKFMRRNRSAVAMAATTAGLLIAGITGTTWFAVREKVQRMAAERNAIDLEESYQRTEELFQHLQIQQSGHHLNAGDAGLGAAYLARVIRDDPFNTDAASRITDLLTQDRFHWLAYEPLRHRSRVIAAEFSADGHFVLTACQEGSWRIWDSRTGRAVGDTAPQKRFWLIKGADFSRDGSRVVTVANSAQLWNVHDGQELGGNSLGRGQVFSAEFSQDGARIITIGGKPEDRNRGTQRASVQVWAGDEPLSEPLLPGGSIHSAKLSPDNLRLVTASSLGKAQLWEANAGREIGRSMRHEGEVTSASFSTNGSHLVTTSLDKTARVWDGHTGQALGVPMSHESAVDFAAFSPDDLRIVTVSANGKARLWDAASASPMGEPMKHADTINAVQFSPNGRLVVTASSDRMVRFWDAHSGRALGEPIRHNEPVLSVRFSPNGNQVITYEAWSNAVHVWQVRIGDPLAEVIRHDTPVDHARISPDGTRIVTTQGEVARCWDLPRAQPVGEPMRHEGRIHSVDISPGGANILTASADGTARLWNVDTGSPEGSPFRHEREVDLARFSPEGSRVVTVVATSAQVFDVATGAPLGERMRHGNRVMSADFSPDGCLIVTASTDRTARLWDARTGVPLGKPMRHAMALRLAKFSPDGSCVATVSFEGTARLWDVTTGQPIGDPMLCDGIIHSLHFDCQGRRLVTAGADGTAQLWDARTAIPLGQSMSHRKAVRSARFSPDGLRVVTASDDGTVRIWDARTGQALGEPLSHVGPVGWADFTPDGIHLVTRSRALLRKWHAPAVALPVPLWVAEWAEALAGQRITLEGNVEPVPSTEILTIKQHVLGSRNSDFYIRIAQWLFADPSGRAASPWALHPSRS